MSSFRILLLCMCLMAVIVTAGCLENPSDSSVSPSSASATPSPTIQPTAIPVASVTTNQNTGTNPTPTVGSTSGSSGTGSTCAAGYTLGSDGNCYNYASDTNNCGSYGTVCASGKVCSAGACVSQGSSSSKSCAAGYTLGPDGNCYDYASDNNNCGSYGTVCPSGDVCSASTCVSGGTTTTTTTPGVTITSIIHVIITPRLFLPTTTTATPTPTPTPTPIRTIVPVCHGSTCM